MRILLIGNYAPDRQESMLRFAELMHRELTARGHSVMLLQPKPILGGSSKWLGYADKFLLFPFTLNRVKKKYDVVHLCDHSNSIYAKYLVDLPNIATCHDVLAIKSALGEVPQNIVSSTGRKLQQLILDGLKIVRYVVCDSEISREDMLRVTGRAAETSAVVYLSLNYDYCPMPRAEALALLDRLGFDARTAYFIHVGGAAWYKNRLMLLRLFSKLRTLIVEAGQPPVPRLLFVGGALDAEMLAFVREAGLDGQVVHLSGVSNEDLRAAYSLSSGLLFPSLQEGFGWPVLEAQSCGCPVFATRRKPMTELGGDAAVYFDPANVDAAARIVCNALPQSESLRRKGFENVRRFSIQNMIDGYLKAYEHVSRPTTYNSPSKLRSSPSAFPQRLKPPGLCSTYGGTGSPALSKRRRIGASSLASARRPLV
jgi:glycosyltransferase involved in cell wall biosynthesis